MPEDHASLLAETLIENDLRGVLSHGSLQIARYVREIAGGGINPTPSIQLVQESPTSVVMDGDGGLGYFPAYQGTLRVLEKARQHGMAALVTRNHGHIGAAANYARLTLADDMLTFVTSGVQLDLQAGRDVYLAAGFSPMAFSAPALQEPPLVLDCGVTHDFQGKPPFRDAIAKLAPGVALRAIGFGTVCQAWGGLLAGIPIVCPSRRYAAANQGAMLFTCKISLFADPEQFKREMDAYARQVRQLKPIEGSGGAFLPGGIEAMREETYRRNGIPLSDEHRAALEKVAQELQLVVPWREGVAV